MEAKTEVMRWKLGSQAKYALLREVPALPDVQAHFKQ
jgi:hypothetical protein